jgi:hypothetical protein
MVERTTRATTNGRLMAPTPTEPHRDPIQEPAIRPAEIDQVKGGASRREDPDAGGEIVGR